KNLARSYCKKGAVSDYAAQIDELLLTVPEFLPLYERAAASRTGPLPYLVAGEFGSFLQALLTGESRHFGELLSETLVGDEDVWRRCAAILERWVTDEASDVHDLAGAGVIESIHPYNVRLLVPYAGPALLEYLRATEPQAFS